MNCNSYSFWVLVFLTLSRRNVVDRNFYPFSTYLVLSLSFCFLKTELWESPRIVLFHDLQFFSQLLILKFQLFNEMRRKLFRLFFSKRLMIGPKFFNNSNLFLICLLPIFFICCQFFIFSLQKLYLCFERFNFMFFFIELFVHVIH